MKPLTHASIGAILNSGCRSDDRPAPSHHGVSRATPRLRTFHAPVHLPAITLAVAGIVLAAGSSRRMGRCKALLTVAGETFVARCIGALRGGGCSPVFVVVGAGGEHVETARIARMAGAKIVVNPDPESEQLHSLRLALGVLPTECRAAMVNPVDVPLVSAETVSGLIDAFQNTGSPLAIPVHDGRHGHPVLFGRSLFDALCSGHPPDGARGVVHAHLHEAVEVPVPSLPMDVDTPADLRHLKGA